MTFKQETRYTILKNKDIAMALEVEEILALAALVEKVDTWRVQQGKPVLECVVFESTWKQYDDAWELVAKTDDK